MKKINKILKNIILFLMFFSLFSSSLYIYDYNNSSNQVKATIQPFPAPGIYTACDLGWFETGKTDKTTGKTTGTPDVVCGCPKNQCRLSLSFNGAWEALTGAGALANVYMCLPSSSDLNSTSYLDSTTNKYGSTDVSLFLDKNYFASIKEVSGGRSEGADKDLIGSYYLDMFSSDPARQVIPINSTCRVNPNEKGTMESVAYWYTPGYFDVMQGKPYTAGGQVSAIGGGACATGQNVLFSNTDLFGNKVGGTDTFFGCLPNSINGLTAFMVRLVTGLAVVIALLITLINLVMIMNNANNPEAIKKYQEKMFQGIYTLIGILLSITILSFLGLQILGFGNAGTGGDIFRFFVGG